MLPKITAEQLVERAVRNAHPRETGRAPRWVAVMDAFGIGSTYAYDLCKMHGLDPDELVRGPRCSSEADHDCCCAAPDSA